MTLAVSGSPEVNGAIFTLPKLIVIGGPTGVGKTRFAIDLALRFGAEIVGADSMQIYRRLDIGTAKPTKAERDSVVHHLVDCIDPDQPFDAAAYADQAQAVVERLLARGVLPLVVGGTGLYIKALLFGLFDTLPSDPAVRLRLQQQADQEGIPALHQRLTQVDPQAAERIHPHDTLRIVRALEVLELSGRPISAQHQDHGFCRPRYNALKIGLTLPRDQLYQRIEQRVEAMLAAGLEQEVRTLLDQGLSPSLKSLQSLGYRHVAAYLRGEWTQVEMIRTLKRDHRRYAKRQLTWFGADRSVHWLAPTDTAIAVDLVAAFLGRPCVHPGNAV